MEVNQWAQWHQYSLNWNRSIQLVYRIEASEDVDAQFSSGLLAQTHTNFFKFFKKHLTQKEIKYEKYLSFKVKNFVRQYVAKKKKRTLCLVASRSYFVSGVENIEMVTPSACINIQHKPSLYVVLRIIFYYFCHLKIMWHLMNVTSAKLLGTHTSENSNSKLIHFMHVTCM